MNFKLSNMVRYFTIVVVSLLVFSACTRPAPVIFPFRAEVSPEKTLKAIQDNSPQILFFKSNFKAQMEYPQEGKNKKHSFDGALLYRKDTRTLRLQSFGTFGNTLFDILYRPAQAAIYLPSSGVVYTGTPDDPMNSRIPDFFFFLEEIMNGMEKTYEGEPQWVDGETLKTKKENLEYLFKVNKTFLIIDEKTVLRAGKTIAQISYQDYKPANGTVFPATIKAFFPTTRTAIYITLDAPVMNEPLAENLFVLSLPPKIRYLPLATLDNLFPSEQF